MLQSVHLLARVWSLLPYLTAVLAVLLALAIVWVIRRLWRPRYSGPGVAYGPGFPPRSGPAPQAARRQAHDGKNGSLDGTWRSGAPSAPGAWPGADREVPLSTGGAPPAPLTAASLAEVRVALAGLRDDLGEMRQFLSERLPQPSRPAFAGGEVPPVREAAARFLGDGQAVGAPAVAANLDAAIEAFCQQRLDDQGLIEAARQLGLRWGSALAKADQCRVEVLFESPERRILVFQKRSQASDYFLVLRGDAYWNFDLELLFHAHAPDGGRAACSIQTRVRTVRPSLGTLVGGDLEVSVLGEVEVSAS